jgi:hypothetical protein
MSKIIFFILHTFKQCKDDDLEHMNNNRHRLQCKKCGRIYFKWNN